MLDRQISTKEMDTIVAELLNTKEVDGDVVEFGCYAGDTSVLLGAALKEQPNKWLYLYDSFEGLPEKTAADNSERGWRFAAGELKASPDTVAHKFKKHQLPDPVIIKAWFNELKDSDLPECISFALFDGDFYESIRDSFTVVAPRLSGGGIIIVHDYRNLELPGSAKAVNEFMSEHSEEYTMRVVSTLAILTKK